jgi:HEAT repeat protein
MTYAEAVALLRSSESMCRGAEALAKMGNKAALMPLLEAHSAAEDAASRSCVKEAMAALGAGEQARRLVASDKSVERHAGVTFMGMFKDEHHAAILGQLIDGDPEPSLRAHAVEVLWLQKRTGPWESIMVKALDHADTAVRRTAAQALTGQWGASVLAALRKRLVVEKESIVRSALESAIRSHEAHSAHKH